MSASKQHFAQEKLELLSVVATQMSQRDLEIENIKRQIERVIESQEIRGEEITQMEKLLEKKDMIIGLKFDSLANQLENIKV